MDKHQNFSTNVLHIEPQKEVDKICRGIRQIMVKDLRRRGAIVALSGGIDSSVTSALAAKALGPDKVIALLMPERHSADNTLDLSEMVADQLGITKVIENISGILESIGFYQRYNDAVRQAIPEYSEGWQSKIVTPNILEQKQFSLFSIVAKSPEGETIKKRLPLEAYLEIVAATNFKQRTRKMLEYYYADRYHYAVFGTPNRLEYDQGFFVKNGDGAADIKPIAHLYKTQVYQLAEYLELPEQIRMRPPTTDTYSLPQGQDEFYFSLPYHQMDLCLYAKNNNIPVQNVSSELGLTPEQVQSVYDDIDTKRRTTRYLQLPPMVIDKIPEID